MCANFVDEACLRNFLGSGEWNLTQDVHIISPSSYQLPSTPSNIQHTTIFAFAFMVTYPRAKTVLLVLIFSQTVMLFVPKLVMTVKCHFWVITDENTALIPGTPKFRYGTALRLTPQDVTSNIPQ